MLLSIKIITEYPLWFTVFCLLLGVVYSFWLYRKEEKLEGLSLWTIRVMIFFRFALVSILAFLLLSPFIKTLFNKVEKPIIVIAQDNTTSILLNKDSAFYKNEYLEGLKKLREELEGTYEVKNYTFGENIEEGEEVNYSNKITDLSNLFDEVNNKLYNRNVGALILATDGIFNQGTNPLYGTNKTDFPVYTIALGDTAMQRDILIKEVVHNKITFLGNQFPLEIDASAQQCKSTRTQLSVTHKGKIVFTKSLNINSDEFSINENLLLEATEVGVQHYQVIFSEIEGEVSKVNNVKNIYIEVLDGRQNILLLANAPHPDIKAIKLSIESNENYEVTTHFFNKFDGNTKPYSLIIIHQLPNQLPAYFTKIQNNNISKWYILGGQTSIAKFNRLNLGLNISNPRNKFNDILPTVLDNFPLFTLSEQAIQFINLETPLTGAFGTYQLKGQGYSLLNQKIGSVKTETPLFLFLQNENSKSAILAGEGIWRWRMHDFVKNNNHNNFNELINKTVQFLSVKEDKSKFRVFSDNRFLENQEILFNAELYNDSYELINEPEIHIDFWSENDNKYQYVFNRSSTAYILNAGTLPIGSYKYKAMVELGGKKYEEVGQFQVNEILMEANNTVANHQLLQNISEKFGGELFYPTEMQEIANIIEENNNITPIIYEEKDLKELINLKWIFFLILTLLSLEWFLRKRNGAY